MVERRVEEYLYQLSVSSRMTSECRDGDLLIVDHVVFVIAIGVIEEITVALGGRRGTNNWPCTISPKRRPVWPT